MTSALNEGSEHARARLGRWTGLLFVLCLHACTVVRPSGDSESTDDENEQSNDDAADEASHSGAGSAEGAEPDAIVSSSEVTGALEATLPPWQSETPKPMYRLDLVRDEAGSVSVQRVTGIESMVQPLTAYGYEYLIRGWVGDEVVAAFPMQFPSNASLIGVNDEGGWLHGLTELHSSSASVFLPADQKLDRIEVVAQSGDVLDVEPELLAAVTWSSTERENVEPTPDLAPAAQGGATREVATPAVETQRSALTGRELHGTYPHIKFLTTADTGSLDEDTLAGSTLTDPTPAMYDVIAKALTAAPPALLASASSIAVVRFGANEDEIGAPTSGSQEAVECMGGGPTTGYPAMGALLALASGSVMLLNANLMLDERMQGTLLHELTHQFVLLSEAVATHDQESVSSWDAKSASLVEQLRVRFRLGSGLFQTWQRLQETGVKTEHACGYAGSFANRVDQAGAMLGGFASYYGAVNAMEDIAEYVRTTQFPSEKYPGVCPLFALASEVTEESAIAFGKLTLLRGLGLITEDAFQRCVGRVLLPTEPGIRFQGSLSFDKELKSGYLDDEGVPKFGFMGSGPDSYQLLIKVSLPGAGAPPLGLHRLGGIWFLNIDDPRVSGAYVGHDDKFKVRASESGLVLITEASDERVQGVLLGLTFQNAWAAITDYVPYGTFLIPRGSAATPGPASGGEGADGTGTDPEPPASSEPADTDETCDTNDTGGTLESSGCASSTVSAGDESLTIEVGGESREYLLHVPAAYDGSKPVPLIVDFHALDASGPDERSSSPYPAQTDSEGVIMAFPTGKSGPSGSAWNVGPCCVADVDDVEFAKALVKKIEETACIDSQRVYAVGFALGGGMAQQLACHAADVFAAVAPAAFDLLAENVTDCEPARPITVVSFRGADDPSVPYAGGGSAEVSGMPITFLGAAATFATWAELNGCTGTPSAEDANGCSTYSECQAGAEVVLCTKRGGGHEAGDASVAWPILKRHTLL